MVIASLHAQELRNCLPSCALAASITVRRDRGLLSVEQVSNTHASLSFTQSTEYGIIETESRPCVKTDLSMLAREFDVLDGPPAN